MKIFTFFLFALASVCLVQVQSQHTPGNGLSSGTRGESLAAAESTLAASTAATTTTAHATTAAAHATTAAPTTTAAVTTTTVNVATAAALLSSIAATSTTTAAAATTTAATTTTAAATTTTAAAASSTTGVYAGTVDPANTVASGPGLQSPICANTETDFSITTADIYGNPVYEAAYSFAVSGTVMVRAINSLQNGEYVVQYLPPSNTGSVSITVIGSDTAGGSNAVPGSPFTVQVTNCAGK